MKLLRRLESRFGKYAIPNVTLGLIVGQIFAFAAAHAKEGFLDSIALIPDAVQAGEVWRLVTFLFLPPSLNPIFAFFGWMLFYLFGSALEQQWGTFRYNLYLLIGYLAMTVAGMAFPFVEGAALGGLSQTGYLYVSVMLAFAYLHPNFVINIFFILPIRIYWIAIITWAGLGLGLVSGSWGTRMTVLASVINFVLFFAKDILRWLSYKQRKAEYESRTKKVQRKGIPRHECIVCHRTDLSEPELQFRYCSQCEGHPCYCSDHITDHEHLAAENAVPTNS